MLKAPPQQPGNSKCRMTAVGCGVVVDLSRYGSGRCWITAATVTTGVDGRPAKQPQVAGHHRRSHRLSL
jgi:hypothetical protein